MAMDSAQSLRMLAPILRPIPVIGSTLANVVAFAIELRQIHLMRIANSNALREIADSAALLSGSIAQSRQDAERRAQTLSPFVKELHTVVENTQRRANELRIGAEPPPRCWERWSPCLRLLAQDKELKLLRKEMDRAFTRFSTEAKIAILSDLAEIRRMLERMQEAHHEGQSDTLRATLNLADDALYTAHSAPPGCTNGTRERLLSNITADVTQPAAQLSVFWISGLAGTGKSAIARSVCERLRTQNVRLLSFFLSASSPERRDPICVLHTLAFQLACAFPQRLPSLCEVIRRNADALVRPIQEQAKLLLEENISVLAQCSETLVVVLDAVDLLDEGQTGRDDSSRQLLTALVAFAYAAAPIRVRIVATGSPTRALCNLFSSMVSSDAATPTARVYKLEDVEEFEVKQDIRTFLRSSFAEISARIPALSVARWPPEADLEAVATRSNGVFLYAAAAVRCLEVHELGGPEACLKGILYGGPAYRAFSAILDDVYNGVLHRAISRRVPSPLTDQARDLIGSLIIIEPRLPVADLALLMGYQPAEVQRTLDLFHAVLVGGVLPSIFHPTFSEFIQDATRCQDPRLVVDVSLQHADLASRCLRLVNSSIGNNRGAPAQSRIATLAADLRRLSASHTPNAQLYAFQAWPRHVSQAANVTPELVQALTQFTQVFLLSWIDIMLELETQASVEAGMQGAARWCEDHQDLASVADALRRGLREEGPAPVQLVSNLPPSPPLSPPPIAESQSVYSLASLARLASAMSLPSSDSDLVGARADEERGAPDSTLWNTSSLDDGNRDDATVARSAAVSLHHDSESEFEATINSADTVAIQGDGVTPATVSRPSTRVPNTSRHDVGTGDDAPARIPAVPGSHTALPGKGDLE